MAEDYLTDDEQWEAVKHWTASNGVWLLAGVALGVAVLFGYRYYESTQTERDLAAAAEFNALTAAIEKNDGAGARRIAAGILKAYPSTPYTDQAQLTLARVSVDEGQLDKAVAPLTQVMNDSKDQVLRRIARMRLARLLIDQGKPDEAISVLGATDAGAFAAHYHEVRGDAFYAKKDLPGALREYRAALAGADPRAVDTALLELKITDLGAPASAGAAKVKP